MPVTGRACGKIILAGEHAVVYGEPALAGSIDRWTAVTLHSRPGPITIDSEDATDRDLLADPRLVTAFRKILPAEGYGVSIRGNLWIGRGLGSSASLSTALIRAWNTRHGHAPQRDELELQVMNLETVFHGKPSGLDPAVILRQGLVRFQRGASPQAQALATPNTLRLVVIDSGTVGDTAALVARVREGHPANQDTLTTIGRLVLKIERHLEDPETLGPLLTENHNLLRRLGVSTPTLDTIVEQATESGAFGAKLAGAGGGGVVIALVNAAAEHAVLGRMHSAGYRAFATDLPTRTSL